jgi:hypothetical protein
MNGVHFVGEPTYEVTNSIEKNNVVIGKTFLINFTLKNGGESRSDLLLINLSTDDESLKQEIIIEPDETQTVSFTWSTVIIKNQKFRIKFYPKDLEIPRDKYNSGSIDFTINMNDSDGLTATSTPGFEAIYFILLILLFLLIKDKRLKK